MESNKTAVVTGATSGIGLATAIALAGKGVTIIGVGRDRARCEAARAAIIKTCPGAEVEFLLCDLSSQAEVRRLAEAILAKHSSLDILVNNAGTVSTRFMTSEDGIELQFAVNHLAPFLLTHELLPALMQSPQGRIVTVSSGSHYGTMLDFNDLQMRTHYSCLGQYKHVKLCNVIFTAELNRRLSGEPNVKAFALDPGLVRTEIGLKGTSGIEKFVWKLRMKSGVEPSVPADTAAWLCTEPSLTARQELYWYNKQPKKPSPYALREDAGKLLWEASERMCMIRK